MFQLLVHSAEKADQILEFKKSSSQIGEAMQQRRAADDTELGLAGIASPHVADDTELALAGTASLRVFWVTVPIPY